MHTAPARDPSRTADSGRGRPEAAPHRHGAPLEPPAPGLAAEPDVAIAQGAEDQATVPRAAVSLDAHLIARVRGVTSRPAEQRAQAIRGRLAAVAAEPKVAPREQWHAAPAVPGSPAPG